MLEFTTLLAVEMEAIRERLALADINYLNIEIEVSGLVHGSDPLMVQFKVGHSYDDSYTKGGDLAACIREFIQRESFEKSNGTKYLPRPEPVHTLSTGETTPVDADDKEIPF